MKKYGVVLFLIAVLAACSSMLPQYTTYTIARTPQTAQGQQCASQCIGMKQQGEAQCRSQEQQCALIEQGKAMVSYATDTIKASDISFYDHSGSCSRDTSCLQSVQNNFQLCYTNCGGQVVPQTITR